jgi:hypothetical protein
MYLETREAAVLPQSPSCRVFYNHKSSLEGEVKMDAASFFHGCLQAISRELGVEMSASIRQGVGYYEIYCDFCLFCLQDETCGALRVVEDEQLKSALQELIGICTQRIQDRQPWCRCKDQIASIAQSTGGSEGRAADAAFGLARAVADMAPHFAAAAMRKMLVFTDAAALTGKFSEVAQLIEAREKEALERVRLRAREYYLQTERIRSSLSGQ